MGEHAREVDAPVGHEVEVVGDGVLALAVDGLDAEGVRAHPVDLLEVERRPLPPRRRVDPALDQGAAGPQHPDGHLRGLGRPHRVVDDVDGTRVGHGDPHGGRLQHAARPRHRLFDDGLGRLRRDDLGAERPGQVALGRMGGDHQHLDIGM